MRSKIHSYICSIKHVGIICQQKPESNKNSALYIPCLKFNSYWLILCFVPHILYIGYLFAAWHPSPRLVICQAEKFAHLPHELRGRSLGSGARTPPPWFLGQNAPTAHKSSCSHACTIFASIRSVSSLENSVYNSLKHRIDVPSHGDMRDKAENF